MKSFPRINDDNKLFYFVACELECVCVRVFVNQQTLKLSRLNEMNLKHFIATQYKTFFTSTASRCYVPPNSIRKIQLFGSISRNSMNLTK